MHHFCTAIRLGRERTDSKTRNAARKIGIDPELVRILRKHIGQLKYGYAFQAQNGSPPRESNILRRELRPIPKQLKIPKCGLHAFRHRRVSLLIENNVSLPMIRLWIGHGSDKMVARYTHARRRFPALDCKQANRGGLREVMVNCSQSYGGERSSAGRASVCGTEGRGFKPRRSPHSIYSIGFKGGMNYFAVGTSGAFVACQATTCQRPLRSRNVPVLR